MATSSEQDTKDLETLYDVEEVRFKDLDFTEKTIRQRFIKKVFGILSVQLAVTLAIVSVFVLVEPVKKAVNDLIPIFLPAALIIVFVLTIVITCSTNVRRTAPWNFIFLSVFTLAMSFFVGIVCSLSEISEVLLALGICTLLCLGLMLFAMQTKIDFTLMHTAIFSLLLVLIVSGWSVWFVEPSRYNLLALAVFGALVFSLVLVYDTQLIIGGKHRLSISPEEYIFAALILYMDVIYLFLRILQIIRLR